MKHTYTVTGMTCKGCANAVAESLNALEQVNHAEVDLEKAEATIDLSEHLSIEALQKALSSNYSITKKTDDTIFKTSETPEQSKSDVKQLVPLFLIFAYLIVASVLLNRSPWDWSGFMLDFMGLFYIVFSFFKFLDLKGFPESFRMYDPLAKAIPVYGWVYPFMELALGILFLMRIQTTSALILTLVILGMTTVGVTKTLLDKKAMQCACLGTALKLPMTKATFIENSIMIVMAGIMLINRMSL